MTLNKSSTKFFNPPQSHDKIRLFCFPYAGGGASVFREWSKILSKDIGVYSLQLPGRENRILEKPFNNMNNLIEEVLKEIIPYLDRPYIFFGHSIGSKIAYELIKTIRKKTNTEPCHLIVSGSRPPHIPEPKQLHNLNDEEFVKELRRFSGMSEEILNCKELMKLFIPFLRADFTLDETYVYSKDKEFNFPITAFRGLNDKEALETEVEKWRDYTKSNFKIEEFKGGHFFIKTEREAVLHNISDIIKDYLK